jgi:hypothetical protein
LGVVLSVGLVCNGSFFAQAVDQVILNQELAAFSKMTGRPSFSTSVYTFPTSRVPISLLEAETLAQHVPKPWLPKWTCRCVTWECRSIPAT